MTSIWPRDHEVTEEFKDLFQKMYRGDPNDRYSLEEISNHIWMKGPVPELRDIK